MGTVSIIEPSPFDADTAYVVVDAHRLDNIRPYLYKTTDLGRTLETPRQLAVPERLSARGSRGSEEARAAVSRRPNAGVMYSTDEGQTWARFN